MTKWLFLTLVLTIAVIGCKDRYQWNDKANRCMDLSNHWQFVPDAKCGR
jgi:hypothetical protein